MRDVAGFFKILSDESRLQILWLLLNCPELCVCDIMGTLGITQSKASRHLATLRHGGMVIDRREGAWAYYSLRTPSDPLEAAILDALKRNIINRSDSAGLLQKLADWNDLKARCGAAASQDGAGSEAGSCCGGIENGR